MSIEIPLIAVEYEYKFGNCGWQLESLEPTQVVRIHQELY